ncbi:MAG: hypothetical protein AUH28_09075 [Acidobacteria bacterium 13_1_40CM_56_16]|nr:MAG: hypothetical protein AUH28_09075 [Acidobacteria bacterium 13_1_40CM_56_16]
MIGIQEVIVFLWNHCRRHSQHSRRTPGDPFIANFLQVLRGWKLAPSSREIRKTNPFNSHVIRELGRSENQVPDPAHPGHVCKKLERG